MKAFRINFNSLDEGILIIDERNEVYFVNNRFLTMINMKDNGEESLSFSKLVENEKIRDFFVLDGIERQGEIQINGNYLFLNYIPYEGTSHKFHIFFLKDVTDIEDTRSQLMELKFNLDMVEDLLNYVYEGFALVDSEGRIVKWNYEKLLGIKEEDALGRPVQEVINTRLHIVAKLEKGNKGYPKNTRPGYGSQ